MKRPDMYATEAPYYDWFWEGLPDYKLYARFATKASNTLDAMCGTGRVAIKLAEAGMTVTGLDNSRSMLAIARRRRAELPYRIQKVLRFTTGDLRSWQPDSKFDLAVVAANSFALLPSLAEMRQALRTLRAALSLGGTLAIQIDSPTSYDLVHPSPPRLIGIRRPPGTRDVYLRVHEERPAGRTLVEANTLHIVLDRKLRLLRQVVSRSKSRVLSARQFQELIKGAGFRVEQLLGDFSGRPYCVTDPVLIAIARKT